MKKALSLLLSFIMLLSLTAGLDFSAHASDLITGACGENVTFSFDTESGELTIIGSGAMYDYDLYDEMLPSDNLSPFFRLNDLKTVTINPGVTSIGVNAFTNCASVNYVTIPESVTRIGRLAFFGCTSLISIDVDSNNTAYSSQNGVLYNKDKTELILLPITSNNTEYSIPNTVTKIDEYAFCENSRTKELTIPSSVISIGEYAFKDSNFVNINVDSENPVYSSQDGVLFNKDKTELIIYPRANSRTTYVIPDTVEEIDESAFYYSLRLTSVTIPASVTSIGERAFNTCWSLSEITVDSANTAFYSENSALFNKDKTELIQYLYGNNVTSYDVPEGVTKISNYAFSSSIALKSVTIPDSVTVIGNYAFNLCTQLTSLTIGNGLKTIGDSAFAYCVHITDLTLPESVTSIGSFAFLGMAITTVSIPKNISFIDEGPFAACRDLTCIEVDPNNADFCVQDGVLFDSNKARLIQFPASYDITVYTIPDSVTYIGNYAFFGCKSLTEIIIPNSVKSFGTFAFLGCYELTSITIPDSINFIGYYAFLGEINLASVTIPVSVTKICAAAFGNCTALKDVYYNGTRKQWSRITIGLLNEYLTNATIHCTDGIIDAEHPYIPPEDEPDEPGGGEPENPGGETPVSPAVESKKPSRVKIKMIKRGKRKFTVTWKKAKRAKGYIVQYSLSKRFKKGKKYSTKTVTVKNAKALKKTVRKLKKGKRYYVRVRAYNGTANNKKLGKWSKTKSVKVK